MEYISTRNTQKTFSFKKVFLSGLAPDGGLFAPKKIPLCSYQELKKLKNLSYNDLAIKIILKFCGNEFSEIEIKNIVNDIATPKIFPARSFISKPRTGTIKCVNSKKTEIKNRYIIIFKKDFFFE